MNTTRDLHADIGEILLTEDEIRAKVIELGARINADYAGRDLTLVSVLKGSLPFMADLMRAIDIPVRIDLMEVSSYGGASTESSGLVRILKDLSASIAGEDVLIVEDIIDTGLTLNYLIRYLRGKNPASLRICTLLDKPARRLVEIPVDYTGFVIPDSFVVGYGLDFGELYRNLRYVGVLEARGLRAGTRRVSMQRRPLGRGRTLATVAGLVIVIGCILPWWTVGGTPGIPAVSGNGLERSGIVVFLCGIVTLALIALPYAAGDRPLGLDRWLSFAMLAVVGWLGVRRPDRRPHRQRGVPVLRTGPGVHQRTGPVGDGGRPGHARPSGLHDVARVDLPVTAGIERLEGVWTIVPTPFHRMAPWTSTSLPTLTRFIAASRRGRDDDPGRPRRGGTARGRGAGRGHRRRPRGGRGPPRLRRASATRGRTGRSPSPGQAEAAGAHSVMLAPPALARPNDAAVIAHYRAVADAVAIPVVVQDHPASSGVTMTVDVLATIADASPSCRVIKLEDEPSPPKVGRLMAARADLRVLGGLGGIMLLEELRRGAVGTMTGFGFPELLVEIVGAFRAGDEAGARATFHRIMPLIRFENQPGLNLAIRKHIYRRRGAIASERLRAPGARARRRARSPTSTRSSRRWAWRIA